MHSRSHFSDGGSYPVIGSNVRLLLQLYSGHQLPVCFTHCDLRPCLWPFCDKLYAGHQLPVRCTHCDHRSCLWPFCDKLYAWSDLRNASSNNNFRPYLFSNAWLPVWGYIPGSAANAHIQSTVSALYKVHRRYPLQPYPRYCVLCLRINREERHNGS